MSPCTPCTALEFPSVRSTRGSSVFKILKVDGGMTSNDVMMQLQADLLGVSVERAEMKE